MKGHWKRISEEQPPSKRFIKTKIDDDQGERCVLYLKFSDGQWYNDKDLPVFHIPTHWWCHI